MITYLEVKESSFSCYIDSQFGIVEDIIGMNASRNLMPLLPFQFLLYLNSSLPSTAEERERDLGQDS